MFGVVVICGAEPCDGLVIVSHAVELWDVEVFAQAKINKDRFVVVEARKGVLKLRKCIGCMGWELSQISEVKESADSSDDSRQCLSIRKGKVQNKT